MSSLGLLKNRNFRNLFLADLISYFGSGMSFIGAMWFVLRASSRSSLVGGFLSIALFGSLLIFPIAGTIVDKFSRRAVMAWANLLRAAIGLVLALLYFTGHFRIEFVYIFGITGGMGWHIYMSATRGLIQEILETDQLIKGNSLTEISLQAGMFFAAGVAGILYKYSGFGTVLIIDAATYVIGTLFLTKIKYEPIAAHDKEQSYFQQFSNGFRYLIQNPIVFGFSLSSFLPLVAVLSMNVVLPTYVSEYLKRDSVVYGMADMFFGIGACGAGFVSTLILTRWSRFKVLPAFFLLGIASLFLLTVNSHVITLYILGAAFGLSATLLKIIMNTIIMETIPKSYMGRLMSVSMAFSTLMSMSSAYGVGLFMDATRRAELGFLWLAAIMIVGLLAILCFYRLLSPLALQKPQTELEKDCA